MNIKKLSPQDHIEFGDGPATKNLAALKFYFTEKIVQSLYNIVTLMDCLKLWDIMLAYNEKTEQIIVTQPLP